MAADSRLNRYIVKHRKLLQQAIGEYLAADPTDVDSTVSGLRAIRRFASDLEFHYEDLRKPDRPEEKFPHGSVPIGERK